MTPVAAPLDVLRATALDAVEQPSDVVHERLLALCRPGMDWAAVISAVWIGGEAVNDGMAQLERSCRHTVESISPTINPEIDPRLYTMHRRSASRGVRSRSIRQGIAPVVVCEPTSCPCRGECFYGERAGLPISLHIVDNSISVFAARGQDGEPRAVVTSDPLVSVRASLLIDLYQQTSMPVLLKDRRAPLRPTVRQLRILHLMTYGLTDEKIASELKVTSRTVRGDVGALYTMFSVHSRFELGVAYSRWIAGQ